MYGTRNKRARRWFFKRKGFWIFCLLCLIAAGVAAHYGNKKLDPYREIAAEYDLTRVGEKEEMSFIHDREGVEIGCMVTRRSQRMYEFLDRLITLTLPRVRDFRGLGPSAFDGHGNYSLGLSEQLVFPELNPDKYSRPQGMIVTLVTSTDRDDEARELLRRLGMPLRAA